MSLIHNHQDHDEKLYCTSISRVFSIVQSRGTEKRLAEISPQKLSRFPANIWRGVDSQSRGSSVDKSTGRLSASSPTRIKCSPETHPESLI